MSNPIRGAVTNKFYNFKVQFCTNKYFLKVHVKTVTRLQLLAAQAIFSGIKARAEAPPAAECRHTFCKQTWDEATLRFYIPLEQMQQLFPELGLTQDDELEGWWWWCRSCWWCCCC